LLPYDIGMKIRFSISFKLMAFILPLICLPIATVGYFSFQASVDRVDRLVRREQMVQVKAIAGEINEIFFYCQLDLKTIASLPVLEDYHNARAFRLNIEAEFNHDNIVRLFKDFISRVKYYYQIRYIDPFGRELIKVKRDGVDAALFDQSNEEFFNRARKAGEEGIYISSIVHSSTRNGFVAYWAKAIYTGLGEFAGVVVIDLDHERIIRIVSDIHVEGRGYAFLIDELGRVIAHPKFEPLTYHLGNYPDPSVKEMVLEMMTGASGWEQYLFEGERKVAAFAPIPIMKWSLAVTLPSDEFRKEAIAIRAQVAQVVVITLLFAVAGVSLLTYYLLKPVRALVDATKRIAGGDLEHEIPIQSTDELGDLTSAFNRMVRHLSRTQGELVRSEKLIALGRLSAGVAHEVRNPLNAMKGAIVYLQRQRAGDELVCEYTQLVSEEIDRLSQFVSEFLSFARQSVLKPEPTDLNRLIYAIQNLFEKEAINRGIRLHNQLAEDLPAMAVDPHQIEQVLVNVLLNAMDAMPDGGDITFSSRLLKGQENSGDSPWVRVTVEDNGTGIPADQLKNIFDPFYSTKDGGTGLGLPISLGVVENHGGRIRITSQEGLGTSVIIEWPFKAGVTEGARE
jgi:two-component system, NtrC family, sensor kinase